MSRHPVSLKIDEAIAALERHGVPITLDAIRVNVRKSLTWADFSSDEALDAVIARFIPDRTRSLIIADQVTRERKRFWSAEIAELEEQLEIKRQSSLYDANRIKADTAVIEFLKAKRHELGYEPYAGLFHDEIERIYAMHSVSVAA